MPTCWHAYIRAVAILYNYAKRVETPKLERETPKTTEQRSTQS